MGEEEGNPKATKRQAHKWYRQDLIDNGCWAKRRKCYKYSWNPNKHKTNLKKSAEMEVSINELKILINGKLIVSEFTTITWIAFTLKVR